MSSAMEQAFEAACMERQIPGVVLLADDKSGILIYIPTAMLFMTPFMANSP